MAISGKYGKIDIPNIDQDEPVFILRAKDKLAVPAMRIYRELAESHLSPVIAGMDDEIERFQGWGGLKELPD
ncbi:MAG: hypothetical protein K9M82_06060 [Deltaproteobacteria bacterium]|nr:hypothetical protein [Deltaproteobacteria bacterium]